MNRPEKVLKGLECCISLNGGPMDHDCKECPYNVGDKDDTCISVIPMLEDALKELKEYESGMQTLGEMNDALCEKIAIKQVALKRIADIAYDYDGYDSVEGLKSLIDEIREIAIKSGHRGTRLATAQDVIPGGTRESAEV